MLPHRMFVCEEDFFTLFNILLTVHHVMILGKWPTWRTILFYVFIFIFNSLHVSSTSCSSSGGINCVNTTSCSCHSASVAVSSAGRKFTYIQKNCASRWSFTENYYFTARYTRDSAPNLSISRLFDCSLCCWLTQDKDKAVLFFGPCIFNNDKNKPKKCTN